MLKIKRLAAAAACGAAMTMALPQSAVAEVDEVKVAMGYGIGYLPLVVMQQNKLVEKHLKAAGLDDTEVTWSQAGAGAVMNDAIVAGQLHFASGGIPPFLILWDKTKSNVQAKGVAALSAMPIYLNTRNPEIKTIKDFTPKDRIAIAGAGSSVHTITLQMAAADAFGKDNYNKLSTLMVNLAHPDGMAAMLSGREVNSHFTSPPFQYQELREPGVRRVLSSYDVMGGRNSFLMVWSTEKFREKNPKSYQAFHNALKEATEWINADKRRAAELYVQATKTKETVDELEKFLEDPEIAVTMTPEKTMKFMEFQHSVGSLKNKAASWKDLFFPEVHHLKGS
jgi:NitT/TauT family transport system substrate-binding protein